jgi:hypothetical protein
MAERPHSGRVTWLGGSGHRFRRFDQIRQPNGAGIGILQIGTVHKNTHQRVRYASRAWATKMLMLNKTPAAVTNSIIRQRPFIKNNIMPFHRR